MELIETHVSFGGEQQIWAHDSHTLNCHMRFAVYLPPKAKHEKCPVLYWLSGLTCTEQNFVTKAAAQKYAAEYGLVIVAPDTSPRGNTVANDEGYDLGQGAGFYLNATQSPWSDHYQMFDYITEELPRLIEASFPVTDKKSISGHSMGGHGALICTLKTDRSYQSVSAFSPICAPSQVPWGKKAFTAYLGEDPTRWAEWDASVLLRAFSDQKLHILIDQGTADEFLTNQLLPESLVDAATEQGHEIEVRLQEGYDHSYYFIASFIEDHIKFHAKALLKAI